MRTPLTATTAMLAVVLLLACRSHKEATATTKEQYDIEAAGSSSIATTSRSQWLSRLSLDIDSFEILIPALPLDTAMVPMEQFALPACQPRSGSVVLRGKHARLGKADIVQRDATRLAEQVDTLSAHRSIASSAHQARDDIAVMKPPDITWWPWLLLTGLLVASVIIIRMKDKE